jgi:hypothetical protein
MTTQKIHVVPHEEAWAVKVAGKSDPASVRPTKKEALSAGKSLALAEEAAVVVHRQDGTFDTVIPFRRVQEEAEKDRERVAEVAGTPPQVRSDPSGSARGREMEEGPLNWTALLFGAAAIVAVAFTVKTLFRMVAGSCERDEE